MRRETTGEYEREAMTNIVDAKDLMHEYVRRDEEGNIEETLMALDPLNLTVKPGKFIAVLGHNGSGKSTFAKHVNALLEPTGGSLWVNGMDVTDEENIFAIRQSAGMVFQNPDEIWERVEKSLKAVGMWEYREHSPNKLSGGQKQRVAIAGVMAMEPKCIVLDEPTAMLDPDGRKEVLEAVHELNRSKGVTVILITHYMEEVVDADYVFVMDQGKVVMEGEPREIFSHVQELKSHRLDVPQITLLAHELKEAGMDLPDGILTRKELIAAIKEAVGKKRVGAQAE